MSETRKLRIVVSGTGKGASDSLKGVQNSVKSLDSSASSAGSRWSSFGTRLAGVAAAAATGLVGATAGAVGFGLKTAAAFEQTEVSFGTLLKSNAKAKQEMAWLKEKAAATPFELADLANADRTLLGFGFKVDKVSKDFLMSMGEIAAAVGLPSQRLPDLARVFGQVHAAGTVSMEDINQLIDAGVPIWDMLTAATGKNVKALREDVEARKLSADTFEKAATTFTKKNFAGAMQKQSQTLAGMWSSLKDSISLTAAAMVKPLIPLVSNLIPKMADLGPKIGTVFVAAFSAIARGIKGLVTAVKVFVRVWQNPGDGVTSAGFNGKVGRTALFLRKTFDKVKAGVQAFFAAFRSGKASGEGFSGMMSRVAILARGLWGIMKAVAPVIGAILVKAFQVLRAVLSAVLPTFIAIWDWGNRNRTLLMALGAAVLAIMIAMKAYAAFLAVLRGAYVAWIAVQTAINVVMSLNPIGVLILAIVGLVAALVVVYKRSATFRAILLSAWTAIKNGVMKVIRWFTVTVPNAFKTVYNKVRSAVIGVKQIVSLMMTGVRNVVAGIVNTVVNRWRSGWTTVSTAVATARDRAIGFVTGLRNGIATRIGAVITLFAGIPGRIGGIFGNAGSWLMDAGRRIIRGLIDGISGMIGSLRDKLGSITKMLPDWKGPAKVDARILNPSGRLVMQGFIAGVKHEVPAVKHTLNAITGSLGATTQGSLAARTIGAGAGGGNVIVHVTVEGSVMAERELVSKLALPIRDAIHRNGTRNRGTGL